MHPTQGQTPHVLTTWHGMELCTVRHCSELRPARSRSQSMCPKRRLVTVGSPSISPSEKYQPSARGDALRILLWALEVADESEIGEIGAHSKLGPISPISPISSPEPDLLRTRTRLPKA
jgi:hypothetical protein